MAIENSKIEWTEPSWNPWQGCVKKIIEIDGVTMLRDECRNCYMYRDKKRYGQKPQIVVRSKPVTFNKPLKIQREYDLGKRSNFQDRLVFACSWSDFFNAEADGWRPEAWKVIRQTPDLTYQILTKLPDRIGDHLPPFWDEIKHRIWLGYSCGMPGAEGLIPELFGFGNPVNFLSCEPLSGFIELKQVLGEDKINWVIVGGESGPDAKPMHPQWTGMVLNACRAEDVPVFFKQWGEWLPVNEATDGKNYKMVSMGLDGVVTPVSREYVSPLSMHQYNETSKNNWAFERQGVKKAGAIFSGKLRRNFPANSI